MTNTRLTILAIFSSLNFICSAKSILDDLKWEPRGKWKVLNDSLPFEYYFSPISSIYFNDKDWYEARRFCVENGGDLLNVDSVLEEHSVFKELQMNKRILTIYWFGLNDLDSDSIWTYTDGSPITPLSEKISESHKDALRIGKIKLDMVFERNSPNNYNSKCARIAAHPDALDLFDLAENDTSINDTTEMESSKAKSFHISITNCGYKGIGFICKRVKGNRSSPIYSDFHGWKYFLPNNSKHFVSDCPPNSIDIGTKCIRIFIHSKLDGKDFFNASEHCQRTFGNKSDLVSFHSETEVLQTLTHISKVQQGYWIGYHSISLFNLGDWLWTDNSGVNVFSYNKKLRYSFGKEIEDNTTSYFDSTYYMHRENQCAYLTDSKDKEFKVSDCDEPRGFICQVGLKEKEPHDRHLTTTLRPTGSTAKQEWPPPWWPEKITKAPKRTKSPLTTTTTRPTSTTTEPQDPRCPTGFKFRAKSCYKVYEEEMNFQQAQNECQKSGANLVSILSSAEEATLRLLIRETIDDYYSFEVWIGMQVNRTRGENIHSSMTIDLLFWLDGHPAFYNEFRRRSMYLYPGKSNVQCATHDRYWWELTSCDRKYPFVCKYDNQTNIMKIEKPKPNSYCPVKWKSLGTYCYYFEEDEKTWGKAVEFCMNKDPSASLITIENEMENKFVSYHLDEMKETSYWRDLEENDTRTGWMGFYRSRTNLTHIIPVDGSDIGYENWEHAWKPGKGSLIKEHRCAAIMPGLDYGEWKWDDCRSQRKYVCKMPRILLDLSEESNTTRCPEKGIWVKWESYCYMFLPDEFLTWSQAISKCKSYDEDNIWMDLTTASIHSLQENIFIKENMFSRTKLPFHRSFWIGLKTEGTVKSWSDGSTVSYKNLEDEYDWRWIRKDRIECGKMDIDFGTWESRHCEIAYGTVCKTKARKHKSLASISNFATPSSTALNNKKTFTEGTTSTIVTTKVTETPAENVSSQIDMTQKQTRKSNVVQNKTVFIVIIVILSVLSTMLLFALLFSKCKSRMMNISKEDPRNKHNFEPDNFDDMLNYEQL